MTAPLSELVARYHAAAEAWQLVFNTEEDVEGNPQWSKYEDAGHAILSFPCGSIEDVREKAAFLLSNYSAFETVKDCFYIEGEKQVWCLTPFLKSLLGHIPSEVETDNA